MRSATELDWYAAVLDWRYRGLEGEALLQPLVEREFKGRIALLSSFGAEAALLLHMGAQVDATVPVVFLDTGKLFAETLGYRDALVARLGLRDLRIVSPDPGEVARRDPQGTLWHNDADACCRLRKVEPLARARRARIRGARPAAASPRGRRLPVDRLHALHRPRRASRGPPRRALARPRQGRMRHPRRTATQRGRAGVSDLDDLESQSVFILREAFRKVEKLGLLWSIGKDSNVLVWLARKAFFGRVPFPAIHIDTSYKLPEMIRFRERRAREWGLELIVGRNHAALAEGMNHTRGRVACCTALKTEGLKEVIQRHGFTGVIAGIRRDEEGTRAKEHVFSPRAENAEWNFRDQPPEFWNHFNTEFPPGIHLRIHPLLHWTELDVWRYVRREGIPVVDLYFARGGRRYRSLGCAPCTGTVASEAADIDALIAELESTRIAERAGRAQDQEAEDAFERLRAGGYM